MVYVISYDLNKLEKDYEGVFQAIKDVSNGYCCHCLKSTWIIQSELRNANDVFAKIKPHLDSDDGCIIVEATNNMQGVLEKANSDMIKYVFS